MHFISTLALSSLALQASAFLIPAEAVEKGVQQTEDYLHRIASGINHRTVELDCPECPLKGKLAEDSEGGAKTADAFIPLKIDVAEDNKSLQINGQSVFPPPRSMIPVSLSALEIRKSDGAESGPVRLGYALEVLPHKLPVTDISMTTLQLTILDLEGAGVKIDTLHVNVVDSWGSLHLADIHTTPFEDSPGASTCHSSLCRVKAIIKDRLQKMAEAAKARMNAAKTWFKGKCGGNRSYKYQHAGEQIEGVRGHHHGHKSHWRRFVHHLIHFFVIPVIFGIMGGLLACATGMIVGRGIAMCLNRRDQRLTNNVHHFEDAIAEDEKEGLVVSDMPPIYEAGEVVIEDKY